MAKISSTKLKALVRAHLFRQKLMPVHLAALLHYQVLPEVAALKTFFNDHLDNKDLPDRFNLATFQLNSSHFTSHCDCIING